MTLISDIEQLAADCALVHSWTQGDSGTSLTMGGVPVRSPAKLIADMASQINAAAPNALIASQQALISIAAKTGAEAARDAALIQSGVYVDEPTGRAAVADGVCFKVQGTGDVAAYEYRRVNATTVSALIATYPSSSAGWHYQGAIASGTSINSLTKAGTYYGAAASTINDKPASFAGLAFQLFIYDGFGINSRFQLQEIRQWGVPNNVQYRWFDSSNPTSYTWVGAIASGSIAAALLAANSVTAAALSSDYNYRGTISTGSVNTVLWSGVYLVNGTGVADIPVGAGTGFLDVSVHSGIFVNQTYSSYQTPNIKWCRYIRSDSSIFGAWSKINIIDDGAVTSAKISAGAVTNAHLSGTFLYRGQIASGSLNSLVADGTYLVNGGLADAPAGSGTGYLKVAGHGVFLLQEYYSYLTPSIQWVRYGRTDGTGFGAWVSLNPDTRLFAGKKIAFIGDSITMNGDYPARVSTRLGCTSLQMGFGGCRMGAHAQYYDDLGFYKLAGAISSGVYTAQLASAAHLTAAGIADYTTPATLLASTNWATIDFLVVMYGTNDWGNTPIGTDTDISSTGASFKGAMNYGIQTLLTAYPNIKVLFVTPMFRSRQGNGDGLNSDDNLANGTTLISYADAVTTISNKNHLPSLDIYRNGVVNKWNSATYLVDGLHPIAGVGYQLLADKVSASLVSNY
jgi:hypothetical protein